MKIWSSFLLCCLLVLLTASAQAVTLSGRASTVFEWYDTGQEETATPAYQYLLFNAKDLWADGYNFRLYGRLADDLSDEDDVDSRLYYAYLEKKGLIEGLDFKLGRQFLSTTAGASLMDGLYLDYHNLGPLGVRVFGGGDVSYYDSYNAKDLIDGIELYGNFLDGLRVKFSYLQRWDDTELANELFGFSADYDYADLLNLYSEVQYNYLNDAISYVNLGANYHRVQQYSVRLEYLYSLPVFTSTSIYSVFAVDEYQEVLAELTYHFDQPGLRAFGRYTREIYQDYADANVFEFGLEKIRTERFSGYVSGTYRDDEEGQDLTGIKVYGAYLFNEKLRLGAGAHVDVLERRLDDEDDETTSSRVWADATLYLTKKIDVQAKVERTESDLWDEYYRGRIRLNVRF